MLKPLTNRLEYRLKKSKSLGIVSKSLGIISKSEKNRKNTVLVDNYESFWWLNNNNSVAAEQ